MLIDFDPPGLVVFLATPAALLELAELVDSCGRIDVDGQLAPERRRESCAIDIADQDGPIDISMATEPLAVFVRGSSVARTWLADVLKGVAEQPDPTGDDHIEYYPGHPFLSSTAMALVVCRD